MDYIFMEISSVWRWLGTATLGGLLGLFVWLMWDILKQEMQWWRKNRDYVRYIDEG